MKGSTIIVNFMTHRARVLMLGWAIWVIIVNTYYRLVYQYTAHWSIFCYEIMMLLTYSIIDFHIFYDGAVDIQIWALQTRSRCKVSDTHNRKGLWAVVKIMIPSYFQGEKIMKFWKYVDDFKKSLLQNHWENFNQT